MEILVANDTHVKYAQIVCDLIYESALQRGTGIAKRSPEYISKKMIAGRAVVALEGDRLVGFSYIETWQHQKFVATSGLVVDPEFRKTGLARKIKRKTFDLSRELFPDAKIFSITTGLAVMKLNSELGYVPVTFSELTDDNEFWKGCEGCRNYDILLRNDRKMCLCTGMLFDPAKQEKEEEKKQLAEIKSKVLLSDKRIAEIRKMMKRIHLL